MFINLKKKLLLISDYMSMGQASSIEFSSCAFTQLKPSSSENEVCSPSLKCRCDDPTLSQDTNAFTTGRRSNIFYVSQTHSFRMNDCIK